MERGGSKIMKKIVKILGVTLCSLILIGCGGKKDDSRVMEEAKIAFASKEYEKAEGILKLAMDEKKDKEADKLYEQVKAFRNIKGKIDSLNMEENFGFLSFDDAINGMYTLFEYFKIFDDKKTESTLVTSELTQYVDELKISLSELISMYNQYLFDYDIDKAKECLEHIKAFEGYKLGVLSDYDFNIKELEKTLKEYEEKSSIDSSNVNGYTREEIDSILKSRFGVYSSVGIGLDEDLEEIIQGELCYGGSASWNNGNRVRGFYVGIFSGNIYNDREEKVGELKTFEIGALE